MNKIREQKQISKIAWLFMFTYMISYVTRINYGAIVSEMERATRFSRSLLSASLTGSFITYGIGQIVSGILGDRFSPKKLIASGFVITIVMNLLIPVCPNALCMTVIWCINGFAQSFMWPPMVRIMTELFTDEDYNKVTVRVSWGSSLGTIIVYLISPVVITFLGWRGVFVSSAVAGVAMLLIWLKTAPETQAEVKTVTKASNGDNRIFTTPLMLGVMLAIILQGMLRDGVTTWMPTYISETYNLSSAVSILSGVCLPVFSIITFQITSRLYEKKFTNPLLCAAVIFAFGTVSALCLCYVTGLSVVASTLLSALLTAAMHGVNFMLICMVPAFFKKYGNVSTASGILNSCTYVGAAISTYGVAVISQRLGWNTTIILWFVAALLGTVVCFACVKSWNKNMN